MPHYIRSEVLLHDIRSAENVGAIFRTADALGVERVWISGYTPAPVDRFGRPFAKVAKSALGAERTVQWSIASSEIETFVRTRASEGWMVVAIEQDERSVDYKTLVPDGRPILLLVGNEVEGIPVRVRACAEYIVEIPMRGKKGSLNVSSAFAVAAFRLLDR